LHHLESSWRGVFLSFLGHPWGVCIFLASYPRNLCSQAILIGSVELSSKTRRSCCWLGTKIISCASCCGTWVVPCMKSAGTSFNQRGWLLNHAWW
jgi:hypothetical protein